MINSCTVRSRKLDPSNRELWILVCALMAVLAAGMGILSTALLAAVPAVGAGTSDLGRGFSLGKDFAPNEQNNQAGISSPATGESVSGAVPIVGTASGSQFARYELYFKAEPSGDEAYVWFTGDTRQVRNGQLGVWSTDGLTPGNYTLRLRVVRPDGNYGEFFARNIRVSLKEVTPTPDGPTPTPIPIDTPTPLPQPTVAPVQVQQPDIEEPTAESTPTTAPAAPGDGGGTNQGQASSTGQPVIEQSQGVLSDLGESLSLNRLRARFITGVRWSAGLFLLLGAIFAAKRLLVWVIARTD